MPPSSQSAFLKRRNALWQQLRELPPGSPSFEAALTELSALIRWERRRVLAGLGLTPADLPAEPPAGPV